MAGGRTFRDGGLYGPGRRRGLGSDSSAAEGRALRRRRPREVHVLNARRNFARECSAGSTVRRASMRVKHRRRDLMLYNKRLTIHYIFVVNLPMMIGLHI